MRMGRMEKPLSGALGATGCVKKNLKRIMSIEKHDYIPFFPHEGAIE